MPIEQLPKGGREAIYGRDMTAEQVCGFSCGYRIATRHLLYHCLTYSHGLFQVETARAFREAIFLSDEFRAHATEARPYLEDDRYVGGPV